MFQKIDVSVWLTMAASALLAVVLLSFNFINRQQCEGVALSLQTNEAPYKAGQRLNFQLNRDLPNAVWNFGDESERQTGTEVSHTYFQAGTFTITVLYGSGCEIFETIIIENTFTSIDHAEVDQEIAIIGQHEIPAGSPLALSSNINADSYEWFVKGKPALGTADEKQTSFVFDIPGAYYIVLKLDHDPSKIYEHKVLVTAPIVADILNKPVIEDPPLAIAPGPSPTPVIKKNELPQPEKGIEEVSKTYISVTNVEMQYLLNDVIEGKKSTADFNKYLCNGGNTKVVANGNATVFAELITLLTDKKGILGMGGKRKIRSVKQTFDPNNGNCVLILSVDYK